MKTIYTLATIFCFFITSAFAQNSWVTYNTSNSNISSNNVWAIAVDSNNKKFMGVNGGNSCTYNDTNWSTYDLPSTAIGSNYCWDIAFDNTNHLWEATEDGIWKKDDTGWVYYAVGTTHEIMFDNQGQLWAATINSLRRFDGSNWTSYTTANSGLANNFVNSVYVDNNNNVWAGTYSGGVSRYDGTTWTTYNTSNGLPNNRAQTITQDADGNIWVGFYNDGAAKFNGSTWMTYNSTNSGLAINRVYKITTDHSGGIWFIYGNVGWGLTKFDGTNWTTYNSSNSGLAYSQVNAIGVDKYNRIWVGMTNAGVSVFDNGTTPLPIGMRSFTGSINTMQQATLLWEIDNPEEVRHFEVERSNDGIHFAFTGAVKAFKNQTTYHYTDTTLPPNVAYYRIRIAEINNGYLYSAVIRIGNGKVPMGDWQIYPNPALNILNVVAPQNEPAVLMNGIGRLIRRMTLQAGSNIIHIDDLPSGIYFIHLATQKIRFVKE